MPLIHEHATHISTPDGSRYVARTHGMSQDGLWIGWLEFTPVDGAGPALRTGTETSQPNRGALEYWALGLEAIYLEGAFARAKIAD